MVTRIDLLTAKMLKRKRVRVHMRELVVEFTEASDDEEKESSEQRGPHSSFSSSGAFRDG